MAILVRKFSDRVTIYENAKNDQCSAEQYLLIEARIAKMEKVDLQKRQFESKRFPY